MSNLAEERFFNGWQQKIWEKFEDAPFFTQESEKKSIYPYLARLTVVYANS